MASTLLLLSLLFWSNETFWEHTEYAGEAIVFLGCLGEFLTEYEHVLGGKERENRRHRLARGFAIVLMAGLAIELLALVRTNELFTRTIAALNQEAGLARKDAGDAIERAAASDLARVQLEKGMAWRHLSEEQKRALCSFLTPTGAERSNILSSPQDGEAWSYANEFANVLRSCAISGGLGPSGHLGTMYWSSDVTFGVWVKYSNLPHVDTPTVEKRRLRATALRKALEEKGVTVAGIAIDETGSAMLEPYIYIGPRVPPTIEQVEIEGIGPRDRLLYGKTLDSFLGAARRFVGQNIEIRKCPFNIPEVRDTAERITAVFKQANWSVSPYSPEWGESNCLINDPVATGIWVGTPSPNPNNITKERAGELVNMLRHAHLAATLHAVRADTARAENRVSVQHTYDAPDDIVLVVLAHN
jgi:hypothetical protein